MSKQSIKPISEKKLRSRYPIADRVENWYFRIDEISNGAFQVSGKDKWGRTVEFSGTDPDELLERCTEYVQSVNEKLQVR